MSHWHTPRHEWPTGSELADQPPVPHTSLEESARLVAQVVDLQARVRAIQEGTT